MYLRVAKGKKHLVGNGILFYYYLHRNTEFSSKISDTIFGTFVLLKNFHHAIFASYRTKIITHNPKNVTSYIFDFQQNTSFFGYWFSIYSFVTLQAD